MSHYMSMTSRSQHFFSTYSSWGDFRLVTVDLPKDTDGCKLMGDCSIALVDAQCFPYHHESEC